MAVLRRQALAPLLAVVLLAAPGTARAQAAAPEYDVKAAFLYNFTKFVEWPADAFHDDRSSLRLCVLGEDPFGGSLREIAKEEVAGRRLSVWRASLMSDPTGCQILFVSQSESKRLPQILAAVRGAPVLTVGDTEGFLEKGGIINFVLQGSKVRFEINQDVAEQSGLKISSKLLRLATRVVPGTAKPGR
jgi:YfiR/HmsC-like